MTSLERDPWTLHTSLTSCSSTFLVSSDAIARSCRSVKSPSPEVLELLLDDERTDVDSANKLDGDTPLHLAVKLSDEQARSWTVKALLEAGADPSIRNKYRDKAVDLLPKDGAVNDELRDEL